MNKSEFDALFADVKRKIGPHSADELVDSLSKCVKDINNVKTEELAGFVLSESIKYANDLVYNLLLAIAVESDG